MTPEAQKARAEENQIRENSKRLRRIYRVPTGTRARQGYRILPNFDNYSGPTCFADICSTCRKELREDNTAFNEIILTCGYDRNANGVYEPLIASSWDPDADHHRPDTYENLDYNCAVCDVKLRG